MSSSSGVADFLLNMADLKPLLEKLVENKVSSKIQYHVACLSDDEDFHHFDYKGVDCFTIKAPKLGPARVIAYDMMAINYSLKLVQEQQIERPIFYILGNHDRSLCGTFCT